MYIYISIYYIYILLVIYIYHSAPLYIIRYTHVTTLRKFQLK